MYVKLNAPHKDIPSEPQEKTRSEDLRILGFSEKSWISARPLQAHGGGQL